MKKIFLALIIVVLITTVFQGCTSIKIPGNNDRTTEEAEATVLQSSSLNADNQTETTLKVIEGKEKRLKTASFVKEDSKKGEKFESKVVEASKEEYHNMVRNPSSIIKKGFFEGSVEMVNKDMHAVVIYPLEEAANPEEDFNKRQIQYIQLPSSISDDIRFTKLQENFYGTLTESSIVFDDINNEIYILKNLNNINDPIVDLRINGAAKLKGDIKTKDLNAIHMYTGNGQEYILLSDKNNTLYIMDVSTFEITKTMEMGEWETLSAYSYRKEAQVKEWDSIYLYQVNIIDNKIRKYEMLKDEIVYECNINNSLIEGDILDLEYISPFNRLAILTKHGEKSVVYSVGDGDTKLISRILKIERYPDGTPLKQVNSIFITGMNTKGYWEDYIGLLQKDYEFPIKLIPLLNDKIWEKIGEGW